MLAEFSLFVARNRLRGVGQGGGISTWTAPKYLVVLNSLPECVYIVAQIDTTRQESGLITSSTSNQTTSFMNLSPRFFF